jgi:hypothetical protein
MLIIGFTVVMALFQIVRAVPYLAAQLFWDICSVCFALFEL